MKRSLWSFAHDAGGQAIVLIAITFLATTMIVGLAIDAGQLFVARRTAQEAADAAAYAGAVVHYQRTLSGSTVDTALANAAAVTDAARNGFVNGVNDVTLTVNTPPTSGPWSGNIRYVEVIITEQVRTAIVPGGSLTTIRVRGVAGSEPLNNQFAIMSLDRSATACPAFRAGANANISLTGGGILVNSTCTGGSAAAQSLVSPTTDFQIQAPYSVQVAGTTTGTWPPTFPVNTSQPQEPDPFAGMPKPSTAGVPIYNSLPSGSARTLNPGIYNVRIDNAGNPNYTLNPGIYILKQGVNLGGQANIVSAGMEPSIPPPNGPQASTCSAFCGVFLFNTHTNYPGAFRQGIDSCGTVNLQGNAWVELGPMTQGLTAAPDDIGDVYNNFLFYQDSVCTVPMTIGGNGVFRASGTVYLPNATFTFDGQNATLTGSQLVAKIVDLQEGNITIDFQSGNTAQPILPRLAE
ncbi:MAG TPA: pilus assembly protein TadG-related protein [Candidatus Limnocylindria bacterium]|nr:pilus assembly protein TadG-related protein [Candidatus Limnocylindria bacterium]